MKGYVGARVRLRNVAAASICDRSVEGATGTLTKECPVDTRSERWFVMLDQDPAEWPRSIDAKAVGYHYWCFTADCEPCEGPW